MSLKFSKNFKKNMNEKNVIYTLVRDGSQFFIKSVEELPLIDGKKDNGDVNNYSDIENVRKYVREHTSGIRYDYDLMNAGKVIVSFSDFVRMISDGYNIVHSEVFDVDMISVEYQKEIVKGRFK